MFRRKESTSLAQETYLKSCQTGRPALINQAFMKKQIFNSFDKENIKPQTKNKNELFTSLT